VANKVARQRGKKTGILKKDIQFSAIEVVQGKHTFYVFKAKSTELWSFLSINRRLEEKDLGYQRVLSSARVSAVASHIRSGNPIPNSLLVALDGATFDNAAGTLTIPSGTDVGWVIDGQHRLAGAHEAATSVVGTGPDIDLCVVAFLKASEEFQIEQFVVVNREAKGVPTALVYDLLKKLPGKKTSADVAIERAAEIANSLRLDESSVFYNRVVVTSSPQSGRQVSITNFVRKVGPHVHPDRGILKVYTLVEQTKIIENYFEALKETYPDQWRKKDNMFFRTIGFGAMMNMFEEIFQLTISTRQAKFRVVDVSAVLSSLRHFDFDQWASYGSGSKAELEAAQDFRTDFKRTQRTVQTGGLQLD
jgi:DGQHR domain-containing protein